MRKLLMCAALALAACGSNPDPLASSRAVCADEARAADARIAACTALIDSGELEAGERADAQALRGRAYRDAGDVTAALRDFEAALRVNENQFVALEGRAAILLASGQIDSAEPLIDRLIEAGHALGQSNLMKGDAAMARSNYAAALAAYDSALEAEPEFALAYARRGRAKQRLEDIDGALADYQAALERDSALVDARAGRCWLHLLREQDLEQARADAETAVAAAPQNVEAQLCRGVLQLRGEEWEAARRSFDTVLAVDAGNPTALFGRGLARRRAGDSQGREDMNLARDFNAHIGATFDDLGVRSY